MSTIACHYPAGRLTAAQWKELVDAAGDNPLRIVSGGAEIDEPVFKPSAGGEGDVEKPAGEDAPPIGWFDQEDGLVDLGFLTADRLLDPQLAGMIGVLECEVTITKFATVILHSLRPEHAELSVRVMAPQGLIFDANHPAV